MRERSVCVMLATCIGNEQCLLAYSLSYSSVCRKVGLIFK